MASGLAGVDLASFQGTPNQWKAAAGNIAFAAVKLTELQPGGRAYVNPDAAADWAYLGQQGLGRIAYLFGHPSQGAAASVALFAGELARLGLADGDAICLDHEVTDGLGPAAVSAFGMVALDILEHQFGRPPLLYTFRSFAAEGNCTGLGSWPLWISDPGRVAGHPQVPAPWTGWAIHQYATSGGIDRDIAGWLTLPAMAAALGRRRPPASPPSPPAPPDIPQEDDMILVQVDHASLPAGTPWPGVFLAGAGDLLHHVTSGADVKAYQAAGIKGPVTITYGEYQGWVSGR